MVRFLYREYLLSGLLFLINDWKKSFINFLFRIMKLENNTSLNKVAKALDDSPLDLQGRVVLYAQWLGTISLCKSNFKRVHMFWTNYDITRILMSRIYFVCNLMQTVDCFPFSHMNDWSKQNKNYQLNAYILSIKNCGLLFSIRIV